MAPPPHECSAANRSQAEQDDEHASPMVAHKLLTQKPFRRKAGKDNHRAAEHLEAGSVSQGQPNVHGGGCKRVAKRRDRPPQRAERLRPNVALGFASDVPIKEQHLENDQAHEFANEHGQGLNKRVVKLVVAFRAWLVLDAVLWVGRGVVDATLVVVADARKFLVFVGIIPEIRDPFLDVGVVQAGHVQDRCV